MDAATSLDAEVAPHLWDGLEHHLHGGCAIGNNIVKTACSECMFADAQCVSLRCALVCFAVCCQLWMVAYMTAQLRSGVLSDLKGQSL